jgi:hypothetical protein
LRKKVQRGDDGELIGNFIDPRVVGGLYAYKQVLVLTWGS